MKTRSLAVRALTVNMVCVLMAATVPGCVDLEPQFDTNTAPIADAGDDQSVDAGGNVQLNGNGSFDPDGDTLSFAWEQAAGDPIALSGANTATPSFQAPANDTVMIFSLTVNDGLESTTDFVEIECTEQEEEEEEENEAPIADAGDDQSVEGNSGVQLDGSASFDPDGPSVSYSWTQLAGTDVSLTGSTTATPTFTAPNEDTTLTFELTVADEVGDSDSDTVSVDVTARAAVLYVANFAGQSIVSFSDPASLNGNITPDTNLQGAQTLLDNPADVIVSGDQDLIVANFTGQSITSYEDAPTANGNLAPDGNVFGNATLLQQPVSIAMNIERDLLFVADVTVNAILVFDNASSSSFNGNRAPIRVIQSNEINGPFGINFGSNDELYVANTNNNNVLVFANASNLNGNVAPSRIIESNEFNAPFDVFVDSDDNLYVVENGFNHVLTFADAATRNGTFDPDFILEVVGGNNLTAVAVDAEGSGYLVDVNENAIFSYDDIATLNGPLFPDRTLQGANTQLDQPIRLFLDE